MKSRLIRAGVLALGAMSLGLGACASTEVDDLRQTVRSLTDRNAQLEQELDACRDETDIMRTQRRQAEQTIAEQQRAMASLRGDLGAARNQFNDFEDRMSQIRFGDLDPATDRALAQVAARYPNMVSYDPEAGRLRFASDLTFDLGSDAVKSEAKESLQALAEVLKSTSGSAYDVEVVGHTDSVPISNPATRQRHATNLHLACHRAISVRRELVNMGVNPSKIMAAGWGEHRPVVPNNASGGTAPNRRVEIYLTRPTGGSYAGGVTPSGSVSQPTTEVQDEYDPIK